MIGFDSVFFDVMKKAILVLHKAYGFSLPSLNGESSSPYWGLPDKPKPISCAGCYQWVSLNDKELPYVWERYI